MDWPIPCWRQGPGGHQPETERGKQPQRGIPYQTVNRLPVSNQYFLRFWMIRWEGCSQRSAPQKRHMAHWRWVHRCHPGNQAAGTREVIRHTCHPRRVSSPNTWLPELLGPGKGTNCRPNQVCAFMVYPRT